MFRRVVTMAGIMAVAALQLPADFTYRETTTITGGAMLSMMKVVGVFSKQAREPVQSTVSVKGDRMVHRTQQQATVIDLAAQTVTTIDMQRKTYTVMTFEEYRQMMEQMSQKMHQSQDQGGKMEFKVSAKDTGNTKEIAGYHAKEMVLRMEMQATDQKSGQQGSMVISSDIWLAPSVAGYQEVRAFYTRMGEKLAFNPGGGMFASSPEASKNMGELYKEIGKLDGIPVLQTISMGVPGQPGSGDASAQPGSGGQQQQQQQQQQAARPSLGGALGGALGGKFGLGRKKQQQDDQSSTAQPSTQQQGNGNPGSLMEATTEMSGFSSDSVDESNFAVPAGFKKVENRTR
ncbi:MAG: hypothetical protein WBL65_21190 [Bryobacteraceae bacterium]